MARYDAIQDRLPVVYGVGESRPGRPRPPRPPAQAQARQLKAYLTLFDQILANEFDQLAHAKDLLSWVSSSSRTYFAQPLDDGRLGLDEIRVRARRPVEELTEGPADVGYARRNRFLDHLLARFGETLTDGPLRAWLHRPQAIAEIPPGPAGVDCHQAGGGRGRAFDYTQPSWGNDNVSGPGDAGRRRKLCLARRRPAAPWPSSPPRTWRGFHLLEHHPAPPAGRRTCPIGTPRRWSLGQADARRSPAPHPATPIPGR